MAPIVDGPGSIDVYYECLDGCQRGLMEKRGVSNVIEVKSRGAEPPPLSQGQAHSTDPSQSCAHSPHTSPYPSLPPNYSTGLGLLRLPFRQRPQIRQARLREMPEQRDGLQPAQGRPDEEVRRQAACGRDDVDLQQEGAHLHLAAPPIPDPAPPPLSLSLSLSPSHLPPLLTHTSLPTPPLPQVAPSLRLATRIGPQHTVATYTNLTSLMITAGAKNLVGQTINCYSYGSGAAATMFRLKVKRMPGYVKNMHEVLDNRNFVDAKMFDQVHCSQAKPSRAYTPHTFSFVLPCPRPS